MLDNVTFIYHNDIQYIRVLYFMVKLQLELSEEENQAVEVYKSVNKLKTKQDAIKKMIDYFEVSIMPKNVKEKEYFK